MNYQVVETREVPVTSSFTGLSGRRYTETNNHGGSIGVAVKLDDGRMAWGFGQDRSTAEGNAVHAAMCI